MQDTEQDGLQAAFDRLDQLGLPFVASDVIQLHEAMSRVRLADTATRVIDEVAASMVRTTESVITTLVELPGMVESARESIGDVRKLLRHELKPDRVKELVEHAEKIQAAVLAAARTSDWLATNIGPKAESSADRVRAALEGSECSGPNWRARLTRLMELRPLDVEQLAADLGNEVYRACSLYERLEGMRLVQGNGHHMAQSISAAATDLLRERWIAPRKLRSWVEDEDGDEPDENNQ